MGNAPRISFYPYLTHTSQGISKMVKKGMIFSSPLKQFEIDEWWKHSNVFELPREVEVVYVSFTCVDLMRATSLEVHLSPMEERERVRERE